MISFHLMILLKNNSKINRTMEKINKISYQLEQI